MSGLDERMDDIGTGWGDELICKDCIYRKSDFIFSDGTKCPQADNCECAWYEYKPSECMSVFCPHYVKE